MAWDFSTEPEFEEKLVWMRAFIERELIPLEPVLDQLPNDEWLAVPPIADTLVVNVGEALKVWTDGIFSSAAHRVINRSGRERYSIPYFMYPSYDALISPILRNPDPASVAPEDLATSMPRDRPFLYGEFKAQSTARIMPGKVKVPDAAATGT